ncbi:hypothetical protein B0H14DRAFT_2598420 [Mycena olivaceomarginata]|nr:hypothetical protein B0H14DRAFT_2598420 [Mycena olivaceomarginata]
MALCSLNIIGTVALFHSFSAQSVRRNDLHSDATQISSSWTNHVNAGLKPFVFLAPIVVRAIPTVTRAPLPLMQSQGIVKKIVRRIGRKILEREQSAFEKNNSIGKCPTKDGPTQGKDIISVLLRARRVGKAVYEQLSDEQISTFTSVLSESDTPTFEKEILLQHEQASEGSSVVWERPVWSKKGEFALDSVLEIKIILATLVRSIVFSDTGVHVEEKILPTLQPVVDGRGGNPPLRLKLV